MFPDFGLIDPQKSHMFYTMALKTLTHNLTCKLFGQEQGLYFC